MSATAMTSTNCDHQIYNMFYGRCMEELPIGRYNISIKKASNAIKKLEETMIYEFNSNVRKIMESCDLDPSSQCIKKMEMTYSTHMKLEKRKFVPHYSDVENIRQTLKDLYDAEPENRRNCILRFHLAKFYKIDISEFDLSDDFDEFEKFYAWCQIINRGKTSQFYFCHMTLYNGRDIFKSTNKVYMTLGYIAELFQIHTTGFMLNSKKTEFYEKSGEHPMCIPYHTKFDHDGYSYTIDFNCDMTEKHICKNIAKFTIGNPIKVKLQSGGKTTYQHMDYIFLLYDRDGNYYNKDTCDKGNYVVLTSDFEYDFDTLKEDSVESNIMNSLVYKFKVSNCGISFFHYFLTQLPIEQQLLYVATFFTRQSVKRD